MRRARCGEFLGPRILQRREGKSGRIVCPLQVRVMHLQRTHDAQSSLAFLYEKLHDAARHLRESVAV